MWTGIDAGSKFLKIYNTGSQMPDEYIEHHGNPHAALDELLKRPEYDSGRMVFTGLFGSHLAAGCDALYADEVAAMVRSLRAAGEQAGMIINVGASSIRCIELDEQGEFLAYRENTLCAAGTGSFLDEQMYRMGFNYEMLASVPFIDNPPEIATRCAVFAKSDLIHRQQEGYTTHEMWNGLCRGVVITMLHTIFHGHLPERPVCFCGGLFLNPVVREWVQRLVAQPLFPQAGVFLGARGAALAGEQGLAKTVAPEAQAAQPAHRYTLSIEKSIVFQDSVYHEEMIDGCEVRVHRPLLPSENLALGIDIGSTSTKLAAVDADTREVVVDIYTRTAGDPLRASRILFDVLRRVLAETQITITACGTTGSGRRLVGRIVGADRIVNEITAHFCGAHEFDPEIETIFEIGGQDAKYIRGRDGAVIDCNMNFVCAAGTGSFIEEQAKRLGFDVREVGSLVLDLTAPHTSDRCTVFMEQDINKLLRDGFSRREVLAGVVRSIVKNYMNRVVGSRPVSGERIFFQGATARNRGLVAAFESITGKQIVVSPYCHVMGAYGAALQAMQQVAEGTSLFRGLEVLEQSVQISTETCRQCANVCTITRATLGNGEKVSWGFMCGREDLDAPRPESGRDWFREMAALTTRSQNPSNRKAGRGVMGIPRVLSMFNYLPLWTHFLGELGFEVKVSPFTTAADKERAVTLSGADFCFPMKVAFSHLHPLFERDDIDYVFYPTAVSETPQKNGMPRIFCPYVISFPAMAQAMLGKKLVMPDIDFRFKREVMIDELAKVFSGFGITTREVAAAWDGALAAQKDFLRQRYETGKKILEELEREQKTGIVCVGRPYNLYDRVINLNLPEHLRAEDVVAFPFEYLIDPDDNESDIPHVYWNYGERILYAAQKIRGLKNVYPVYFTNFGCGPDSFILSRFEKIMQGKPYLIVELDEHGSDTGYLTRIEAFFDVVRRQKRDSSWQEGQAEHFYSFWNRRDRKLWMPPMHELDARLFAAAFRGWGYDAEALESEDTASFEIGKQCVRGSECLPASATIGVFIKKLREIDADPKRHALMMPTAEGPCRFGQYMVLHRHILDQTGYKDVEIFAPTSVNSYMGMPYGLRKDGWEAIIAGDMLLKAICRRRPYEVEKGSVDRAAEEAMQMLERALEQKKPLLPVLRAGVQKIFEVPVDGAQKPIVGIVGEIYVRSNRFCNDDLIRRIEAAGGEAWPSPVSEWIIYTAWCERYFARLHRKSMLRKAAVQLATAYLFDRYHSYEKNMRDLLGDRIEHSMDDVLEIGKKHIPLIFEGEGILTVARSVLFLERDNAALVVNCAPFGCMHGHITATILNGLETKGRVVSMFYDGESDMNRIIGIYLDNVRHG